jgi:TIR domain
MRRARAVLVLLSSSSRKSKWVDTELQTALDSKSMVIPVLLDKGAKDNWLWPLLANRQSVELDLTSADLKSQLDELVQVLSIAIGEGEREAVGAQAPALSSGPSKVYLWTLIAVAASAAVSALITLLITQTH